MTYEKLYCIYNNKFISYVEKHIYGRLYVMMNRNDSYECIEFILKNSIEVIIFFFKKRINNLIPQ